MNNKTKIGELSLSSQRSARVRWLELIASAAVVGILDAVFAFIVNWPGISSWLTSEGQPLAALGAIATGAAAIVGAIGLVVAGVAAVTALRQVELQRQIDARQSARECLWHFNDEWRQVINKPGSDGKSHWDRAVHTLKSSSWGHPTADPTDFVGQFDPDVLEVLNFFEAIGHMRHREELDRELAWNAFGSIAMRFHSASHEFVQAYRSGLIKRALEDKWPIERDQTYWEEYDWWVAELEDYDDRKIQAAGAARS